MIVRLKRSITLGISMGFLVLFGLLTFPHTGLTQPENQYEGPRFEGERPRRALDHLKSIEKGLAYVAEKTRPAVVTVYVEKKIKKRGFPFKFSPQNKRRRRRKARGLGSGVIIRSNGYIVTNYHVVKDVDEIKVLLHNQKRVNARIVGSDPRTDLAVLKIDRSNLPELDFADSNKLRVGNWAIAVGSPFSLESSVSFGHISALNRSIQATQYENFVQTDAAINRGNSGGPLVNIEGEIIGINTIIQSTSGGSQGIGFASASNLVSRTVSDLIEHGQVKRAWLGVSIQRLSGENLQKHFGTDQGALVAQVKSNSPADTAGLEQGDVIVDLNGESIPGPAELQQSIIQHNPGDSVTLTVIRENERTTIGVTLGIRPSPNRPGREASSKFDGLLRQLGLKLNNLSPEQAQELGLDVNHPVPYVDKIKRGSVAQKSGVRPEDVILTVNRRNVKSVSDLKETLRRLKQQGSDSVLFLIQREGKRLYVSIPLPPEQKQ